MIPLRPVVEAGIGGMMASWGLLGAGITVLQTVLGPETAINVGLVVNIGLIIGGAVAVFHAGGIFRSWMAQLRSSEEEARQRRLHEAQLRALDAQVEALWKMQGIAPPRHDPKEEES